MASENQHQEILVFQLTGYEDNKTLSLSRSLTASVALQDTLVG